VITVNVITLIKVIITFVRNVILLLLISGKGNNMDFQEVKRIILDFCEAYEINLETDDVSSIVYQDNETQAEAVECFVNILRACQPTSLS
jgi:hypothetical protein